MALILLLMTACGSQPLSRSSDEAAVSRRGVPVVPPQNPPDGTAPSPPPSTGPPPAPVAATPSTTAQPTTTSAPRVARSGRPRPRQSAKDRVERVLDRSGWDWRGAGIRVHLRYHPDDCCHWGIYDYRTRTIWIGPTAHRHPRRLRYVALHELAHAWLLLAGKPDVIASDLWPWRHTGISLAELAADCIALLWGGGTGHYWRCPPEARRIIARRLDGDWS